MYAQVLIFRPIRLPRSSILDYHVPDHLSATPSTQSQGSTLRTAVRPGLLVVVPLGTQILPGLVMSLSDTPAVPKTRDIIRILDLEPVLSAQHLSLARWLARETLAPLHRCVSMMFPPGMRPKAFLRLTPRVDESPSDMPQPAAAVLELLLKRGPLRDDQVRAALKHVDVRRARQYLKRRKLIQVDRMLRMPGGRPRTVNVVRLAVNRSKWDNGLAGLRRQDLYRAILAFLEAEDEPVEVSVVRAETGAAVYHLRQLESRGLLDYGQREVVRDPLEEMIFTPDTAPDLTPGQLAVWRQLEPMLDTATDAAGAPVLLLGVTGSGKTELYLRATAEVLKQGRQALMLVPEISLTPQTVRRFAVRFPGQVGLWHSGMTDGERNDTWRRVRSGNLSVVVGARSALFAPFPNLGLIVMDEEEDTSYKQGRLPYYHTRETAEQLAKMAGAVFVMGSATPSLEAYERAQQGRYRLLELPARILSHRKRVDDWRRVLNLPQVKYRPHGRRDRHRRGGAAPATAVDAAAGAIAGAFTSEADVQHPTPQAFTIPLPPVDVVDMRAELRAGNRSVFSRTLQHAVDQALERGEQAILFLNRRGSATYVFCRDCGWVAACPRCDIPLTQHRGAAVGDRVGRLVCHRCNYRRRLTHTCPRCGSTRVRAFGLGTEGLASRVTERWASARVLRWDRDAARSRGAHAVIMGQFVRGDADILVGTQMVARGLDIPRVTVVGVISADTALNLPDFRAAERTFQLLAQVAGRAGRGVLGGRAIVQTYHPDHYAVRFAAAHDYGGFAAKELAFRRQVAYPPAIRMARLVTASRDRKKAERDAEALASTLRHALIAANLPETDLIGPAPAFFARTRGRYRWQMLLRSVAPADFLRSVEIPRGWIVDIDPVTIL